MKLTLLAAVAALLSALSVAPAGAAIWLDSDISMYAVVPVPLTEKREARNIYFTLEPMYELTLKFRLAGLGAVDVVEFQTKN